MRKIKLTQNKYALVDDEDYEWLNQFHWIAEKIGNNWYASKSNYKPKQKKSNAMIRMHRLILNFPNGLIDHINGNGLNNQRKNLRLADKSINAINSRIRTTNKTGYKGIYFNEKRNSYSVSIMKNYKSISLGTYTSKREAIKIRRQAELKYHGK